MPSTDLARIALGVLAVWGLVGSWLAAVALRGLWRHAIQG